jgi:hypothetical protein
MFFLRKKKIVDSSNEEKRAEAAAEQPQADGEEQTASNEVQPLQEIHTEQRSLVSTEPDQSIDAAWVGTEQAKVGYAQEAAEFGEAEKARGVYEAVRADREHEADMPTEHTGELFNLLEGTNSGKSKKSPRSGEVVAGMLSALLGMAALTAAHWWSAADPANANLFLVRLSSWLPEGQRIGPYGGKELTALAVWLGSWLILFLALKWFELRLKPWIITFSIAVMILLVLLWPPVYHKIYGWPA